MELILMRHGTTQGNKEGRFVGRSDVDILPEGVALAQTVAEQLPTIDHLYSSPLKRCRQTAQLLWSGMELTIVPQLQEHDFGPFEGKRHEELQEDPMYRHWIGVEKTAEFEGVFMGETIEETTMRGVQGLVQVVTQAKEQGFHRVGVVTHGGIIMALMSKMGVPPRDGFYQWKCGNCCGYHVEAVEGLEGVALHLLHQIGGAP